MAQIRLTIGDIAVTNESLTSTVKFDTTSYQVCLVSLSFQKKMYQPTEIKAELQFFMTSKWVSIGRTDIEETFKLKNAILEVVEPKTSNSSDDDKYTVLDTIGKDFYVHDVRPHYQPECMYVSLKIYSLDKLLTLNKECNTYVGKKLSSILGSVLGNYKVPYETSSTLSYDNSGMQVLQVDASGSDSDDNKDKKEHKFPYLIQYNESFYDLLKRTTNRWGEFLYWENGTLTIGYDDSKPIKVDTTKFTDIYYFDLDTVSLSLPEPGSYDYAAAYDENVGNKPIKKDPYQVYGKLFKFNGQLDKYAFSVASRFFQNEESVTAWAVGLLVDDLYDMIAESKYVKSDNKDFKDNYFDSNYDTEQYNDNEDELNLYSEYGSKYDKDTSYYSEILGYETAAGKNAIRIKYDTTWPEMKLGDVITVKDDKFIVVEVLGVSPKELRILDNSKVLVYPSQTITFEIVATAINKTDNKYYPATLPTGHVRRSGPQVATIVDMDDPLKANRVRVVYDWQGENASESDYSPWLLYAAGSHGSPRAGRHLNGTKVLVGFANDNIERPYVLGNIQEADTFVELKDVSLETPGKRKFQMWDHVGGVQKFVSGTFAPIVSTISDFSPTVDYLSLGDGGLQYAGGFCITDRLGLYNISGSTEEREVKISSAWGDVKVSAFTGISISAPNGDVKIKGKNVEISAGNNLTLTSGKNVGYHVAWGKGEDPSFSTVLSDVVCKLIEKIGEKVQLIDLSFIRDTLEVVFRPHEGSLTLKSNRYMKLETGSNECDFPMAAYNKDKRQKIVDEEAKSSILSTIGSGSFKAVDPLGNESQLPSSISMIRSLIWIINKLSGIFTAWLDDYQKEYDKLVDLRLQFDKAIKYATQAIGEDPSNVLRNWAEYEDLGSAEIGNAYVNSSNPANLMLHAAHSLIGRMLYSSSYRRYGYGPVSRNYETFYPNAPWGSGSKSTTSLIMSSKQYGSAPNYRLPKIVEFWEYTDVTAGTGYAHIVDAVFTTDETLLVRAEAYALLKQYDNCIRDLNYWIGSHCRKNNYFPVLTKESIISFMEELPEAPRVPETDLNRSIRKALHPQGFTIESGDQTCILQFVLHVRRLETIVQGLRFCDIKRYGIEYSHEVPNADPIEFVAGDLRGAIQIPADVLEAGMVPNPREVKSAPKEE